MKKLTVLMLCCLCLPALQAQNNALTFDGTTDLILCPYNASLNISGDVTIEAWICNLNGSPALNDEYVILSQGKGSTDASGDYNIVYSMRLKYTSYGYQIKMFWEYNTGTNDGSTAAFYLQLPLGSWTHLAMVRNTTESKVYFYVDGVQFGDAISYTNNTNYGSLTEFTVGAERKLSGDVPSYLFLGKIDEVRVWSDMRSASEIKTNYNQEYTPTESDNLVLYYKLNETTGSTADNAKGTTDLDGTLSGLTFDNSAYPSGAFFGPNACLTFDDYEGHRPYIDAGFVLNPHSAYSGGFTMEAWIKPDEVSAFHRILAQPTGGTDETIWLALDYNGGNLYSYFNGDYQSAEYDISATIWTHVAVCYNPSDDTLRFYVNGAITNGVKMNSTFSNDGDNMYIGWGGYYANTHFDGLMDEVRIWNDCRTSQEIRENMCTQLTGNETGLLAYYNFDQVYYYSYYGTDDNYILDGSGNNHTGRFFKYDYGDCSASTAFNSWLNTSSSTWTTDANWSLGAAPVSTDNVGLVDAGGTATSMPSGLTLNSLNLGSGLTIALSNTETLTLTGALVNLGTFTMESGSSLICDGVGNSGTINIERDITGHGDVGTAGWHLLSSPVGTFSINSNSGIDPGAYDDLYSWDETTNTWLNHKAGTPSTMVPGTGYLASYQTTATKTFPGTPNNADITQSNMTSTSSSYYQGYHLLGNPFPCALQWNPTSGNAWALSNVNATAHIWNADGASYTAIEADDYIPAMQGFMIYVSSATNSITIPRDNRVHNSTAWMKTAQVRTNRLVLTAHDPEGSTWQETIIGFDPRATEDFDMDFDAGFLSGYAPYLYSPIDGHLLSVNYLPELDEQRVVPLSFINNGSTHYYIEATGIETLDPQVTVFLYDKIAEVDHNLSQNPVYSFTADDGDDYDRFELHFGPVGLSEQPAFDATLHAWYHQGVLHVTGEEGPATLQIWQLDGRCAITESVVLTTDFSTRLSLSNGLYVVKLAAAKGVKTTKILVK